MSRDVLTALRLLFVKGRAYQTKRQVWDRLFRAESAAPRRPDDANASPFDLDIPPFSRQYRVRIVNGVRVLGDKTDD